MRTPPVELSSPIGLGVPTPSIVRRLLVAIASLLVAGCASFGDVKLTLRDVNVVVGQIADVADRAEDSSAADRLYALEARVSVACAPLVEGATRTVEGRQLALTEMLQISMTNPVCRQVVDEVRNEVAWLRGENGRL